MLALAAALGCGPVGAASAAGDRPAPTVTAALTDAAASAGAPSPREGVTDARDPTWVAEGARALHSPLAAPLPYHETLRVDRERPEAIAYRLDVRRGERIAIEVEGAPGAEVFVDLFELSAEGRRRKVHGVRGGERMLVHEVRRALPLLVRVQPGRGVGGEFAVTIRRGASLQFPVAGKDSRSVGSMFGAPRAGGRRTHHGVDIFAPRGTLVVAGADGEAWVGTNNLGGNIIFIGDDARDVWLYYAHLDAQLVAHGARVRRGDPIGRVGNTGNAKTTAPHLHFGIYSRGPIDPYPFIHEPKGSAPRATARQRASLGTRMRVSAGRARLIGGPLSGAERLQDLAQGTLFEVRGVHREFLRIRLPDGATGWLPARVASALARPMRKMKLSEETALRTGAEPSAPVLGRVPAGERVAVLGAFGPALYVRAASGLEGWI